MAISETIIPLNGTHRGARLATQEEWKRVVSALEALCAAREPGDLIPTHTDLMRQFDASERTVLRALTELQRRGRIDRRHGSGTFVAHGNSRAIAKSVSEAVSPAARSIVAIAQPDQSFFDLCINLLYDHARAVGVELLCRFVSSETEFPDIDVKSDQQPGFILFKHKLLPIARRLQDAGYRAVIVGTPPLDEMSEAPCVYGDHEQGGYLASKHLIQLGHTRIAYLHTDHAELKRQRRWSGHERAIAEAAKAWQLIDTQPLTLREVEGWSAEPERAREYLKRSDSPTGIVAWNDHQAMLLMAALQRAGISVPGDVSVIGYDALPAGELVTPSLTTVDGGVHQQLDAAVRLLTHKNAPPQSTTVIVLPQLVQRGSTAPQMLKRTTTK